MIFQPLELEGAYLIKPELNQDERGFFARSFCKQEFLSHGLEGEFVQCSVSYNKKKGTLRGMHFQLPPKEEIKLVRCTNGAVYDVIVDMREKSKTYRRWISLELTEDNKHTLYIPKGFAHGFKTMLDKSEVFYQMSTPYFEGLSSGFRWDDPCVDIKWPLRDLIISQKDLSYPDLNL